MPVFMGALLTIGKLWNQPLCWTTNVPIKKISYIYIYIYTHTHTCIDVV
jgi:hypothetical protein